MPRFSWRCRACRTAMQAHAYTEMWKSRRPLATNWLMGRASTGV